MSQSFVIKGQVPDGVNGDEGHDAFDLLLLLFEAIQGSDVVDITRLRGRLGDVSLRMNVKGEWNDR